MNLTYYQFEVLVTIEAMQNEKISQRSLAKELDLSLGVVNKTINEL